jgi:hypothetical protein
MRTTLILPIAMMGLAALSVLIVRWRRAADGTPAGGVTAGPTTGRAADAGVTDADGATGRPAGTLEDAAVSD